MSTKVTVCGLTLFLLPGCHCNGTSRFTFLQAQQCLPPLPWCPFTPKTRGIVPGVRWWVRGQCSERLVDTNLVESQVSWDPGCSSEATRPPWLYTASSIYVLPPCWDASREPLRGHWHHARRIFSDTKIMDQMMHLLFKAASIRYLVPAIQHRLVHCQKTKTTQKVHPSTKSTNTSCVATCNNTKSAHWPVFCYKGMFRARTHIYVCPCTQNIWT